MLLDGILDDPVWRKTPGYPLLAPRDNAESGNTVTEAGEARLAWDDRNVYLGISFQDSDIVTKGEEDEMHHYRLGDLVELFLSPEGRPGTWELYATPRGKKTSFWLPEKGTISPGPQGLQVASRCEGTLNRSGDRDRLWSAEMAIPLKTLYSPYREYRPGSQWRILVARYNYGRDLTPHQLSSVPQLSRSDFHLYGEHAILEWYRGGSLP